MKEARGNPMDKITRYFLRFWITTVSVLAFLFGWAVLAHAPKPSPLVVHSVAVQQNLPPLAPLPSLEALQNSPGSFSSQTVGTFRTFDLPRLQTMGS
jgi:hypothetical protein